MAQLGQQIPLVLHPRSLSADFSPPPTDVSMLYSILPLAVKSRLPRLPSFRRSVSMYRLGTRRKSADSRPSTSSSSGSSTPGAYTSAMVLSNLKDLNGDDKLVYYGEGSGDENLSGTSTPRERRASRLELTEVKSGIGWKFANQGLNLLSIAVEESSSISQDSSFGNAPFARQIYLHAITYLLRALPSDLTTEEQLSIRSALPAGIVEPLRLETSRVYTSQSRIASSAPPSLLHRALASTIVQLFIFLQFVLPYLKYLLTAAYQYDRSHKISEKVLNQSVTTVDRLARAGIAASGAVYGMNDGKVGQMITETVAWVLEGVTGGIHEGVGEGLVIVGAVPREEQLLENNRR